MPTKDITDRQVCAAYAETARQRGTDWSADYEFPYEVLQRETGECFKVCYAAMERADSRGLIEYGVSLRTGWLTDKGLARLAECKHLFGTIRREGNWSRGCCFCGVAENAQPAIRNPQVLDCSDGTQEYPRF